MFPGTIQEPEKKNITETVGSNPFNTKNNAFGNLYLLSKISRNFACCFRCLAFASTTHNGFYLLAKKFKFVIFSSSTIQPCTIANQFFTDTLTLKSQAVLKVQISFGVFLILHMFQGIRENK
jgi:hypothetical protein